MISDPTWETLALLQPHFLGPEGMQGHLCAACWEAETTTAGAEVWNSHHTLPLYLMLPPKPRSTGDS